jgi:hypothetical protein
MSPKFSPESESAKLRHHYEELHQKLQAFVNFFDTDIDKQKAPLPSPPPPPGGPGWWKEYIKLLQSVVEATEKVNRSIERGSGN